MRFVIENFVLDAKMQDTCAASIYVSAIFDENDCSSVEIDIICNILTNVCVTHVPNHCGDTSDIIHQYNAIAHVIVRFWCLHCDIKTNLEP